MISIDLLRLRDVTARRNKTALSKRESENCVRELEEKILKINQEPKAGWGEHMCRQKSLSPGSGGHVRRAVTAPFRRRVKSSPDKQRICHNYGGPVRPYLIKT